MTHNLTITTRQPGSLTLPLQMVRHVRPLAFLLITAPGGDFSPGHSLKNVQAFSPGAAFLGGWNDPPKRQ